MAKPLRILIVEDQANDEEIIIYELKRGGFDPTWLRVETAEQLRTALSDQDWDVVTSDHSMPLFSAPEALEVVQSVNPEMPVVIVSGEIDIRLAVSLMQSGARDYVQKNDLARLPLVIERELREIQAERDRLVMQNTLRHTEEEVQLKESNFQAVFENSIDAITVTHQGRFKMVNEAFIKLFGFTGAEDFVGHEIVERVAPEDRELMSNYIRDRIANKPAPVEYRVKGLKRDGSRFDAEIRVFAYQSGGESMFVAIVRDVTERIQLMNELLKSERNLSVTLNSIGDAVIATDINGCVVRMNEVAEGLTGWRLDDAKGKALSEVFNIINESTRGPVENPVEIVMETGTVVGLANHTILIASDGTERQIADSASPIRDDDGNIIGVVLVFRDQTEAVAKERALQESEERLRKAELLAGIGHWAFDIAENVVIASEGAVFLYGLGTKTWRIEEVQRIPLPEYRDMLSKALNDLINCGAPYDVEFRIQRPSDGVVLDIHSLAQYNADKKLVFGVIQDVTERNRIHEELRQSEEKYYRLFMDASLGIFRSNFQGQFYDVNPTLARMLGYDSPQEVLDSIHSISEQIYAEPPKRDAVIEKTLSEGNLVRHVNRYRRKNGEEWDAYLHLRVIMDQEGNPQYMQGFVEDISERTRQEAEIRRLNQDLERLVEQRTSELQAFVHSVSHDLRAPIRTAKQFSRFLVEDYGDILDEKALHYINKITEAADHQNDLMDALLQLTRVGSAELQCENVDLAVLVQSAVDSLRAKEPWRQVEIILEDLLIVQGDPRLLQIVIENLINNAWKYTAHKEKALIEVGAVQLKDGQTFYVRDNGTGFDMKYASQVFEVFRRLHSEIEFPGNGVGLSVVQRIIERHGGTIWAEGKAGEGAVFYFTLGSSERLT